MSEWVPESDWSKVAVGDRVRLEAANGDCAEFEVAKRVPHIEDRLFSASNYYDQSSRWSLFVVPKPTPALPTEPGIYASIAGSSAWVLSYTGQWSETTSAGSFILHRPADSLLPLSPLESQADTARKVLAAINRHWMPGQERIFGYDAEAQVAAEFGVTL